MMEGRKDQRKNKCGYGSFQKLACTVLKSSVCHETSNLHQKVEKAVTQHRNQSDLHNEKNMVFK